MFCYGTDGLNYYRERSQRVSGKDIRHTVRLVAPPVTEPVTIQEAKAHLNIGASDDTHDDELLAIIAASREEWERDTSTALITRTLEHRLPRWLDVIRLTVKPVIAVSSVTYMDADSAEQTVSASDYYLDIDEIRFKATFSEPTIEDRSEAIRITYTAGYGSDVNKLPQLDRAAIKLMIGYRFENRDMMVNDGAYKTTAYEALVAKKMRASYP